MLNNQLEPVSDATLPIALKPSFGSVEFGGPTKKYASTGTLYSFGGKPTSLEVGEAHQKMQNLASSTSAMAFSVQPNTKLVETMPSSKDATDQNKSGKRKIFQHS